MKTNPFFLPSVALNVGLLLILLWLVNVDRPYPEIAFSPAPQRTLQATSPNVTARFLKGNPPEFYPPAQAADHPSEQIASQPKIPTTPQVMVAATQQHSFSLPVTRYKNVSTSDVRTVATPAAKPAYALPPVHSSGQRENIQRTEPNFLPPATLSSVAIVSPSVTGTTHELRSEAATKTTHLNPTADSEVNKIVESPIPQKTAAQEPQALPESGFVKAAPSRLSQYVSDSRDKKTMLFSVEQQELRSRIGWQNFYYEPDTP